jgi:hypothetical protein
MPRKVINPKSTGVLTFAATQAGLAAGLAFTDQVYEFKVVPSPNLVDIPATFGVGAGQSTAASSWEVQVSYLQDWGAAALSVSKYLYDNDGALVWFRFNPAGTTEDHFEGQVYVRAGAYGGSASENWVDDISMPCPSKPSRLDPS